MDRIIRLPIQGLDLVDLVVQILVLRVHLEVRQVDFSINLIPPHYLSEEVGDSALIAVQRGVHLEEAQPLVEEVSDWAAINNKQTLEEVSSPPPNSNNNNNNKTHPNSNKVYSRLHTAQILSFKWADYLPTAATQRNLSHPSQHLSPKKAKTRKILLSSRVSDLLRVGNRGLVWGGVRLH